MTIPTFDSSKHHVGLGATGGTSYGFMLEGGYAKEPQRSAAGSSPEFGGQTDLIGQTPSLSRWTQDDFVGGMYAYQWGRDDAMFADCTGFMPMPQSRGLQSVPPMYLKAAIDADARFGYTTDVPKAMFMIGGVIYIAWPSTIVSYNIGSGTTTWLDIDDITAVTTYRFANVEYNSVDQKIWALAYDSAGGTYPMIFRILTDLSDLATWDGFYTGPTDTVGLRVFGGTIFNQSVVAQIGRALYVGDPPDNPDPSADDDTVLWTRKGVLPGRWVDSCPYNNQVYILVNDGSFKSNVFAFDGDFLSPICQLPFNFYAKCMIDYAGRLYVGGTGTDVNGGEHYAELYEITGGSVRLVRTFSPETRTQFMGGVAGEWPQSIDDMTVFEGMLWFGQKGKRMMCYDVTGDGFFGTSEIQSNSDLYPAKLISGRGRLWGYFIDPTADASHGIYRIAQPADSIAAWNPRLDTSDFVYEPAMDKRWSEIVVMSRYGAVSTLKYSVDGGVTWTALTVTTATHGRTYYSTASLAAIAASRLIRFRVELDTTTTDSAVTYHRELIAMTVSFSMLETGKKAWSFTINGSQYVETRDLLLDEGAGGVVYDEPSEVRSTLWGWYDDKTSLTYRDLNGTSYSVKLEHMREIQPVIGPDVGDGQEPEAHYAVTLVEV